MVKLKTQVAVWRKKHVTALYMMYLVFLGTVDLSKADISRILKCHIHSRISIKFSIVCEASACLSLP